MTIFKSHFQNVVIGIQNTKSVEKCRRSKVRETQNFNPCQNFWSVTSLLCQAIKCNKLLIIQLQAEACVCFPGRVVSGGSLCETLLAVGAVPYSCVPPATPPIFFHPSKLESTHPHRDRGQVWAVLPWMTAVIPK